MARTYIQDLEEISAVFPQIGPGERDALLWRGIVDICNENDFSFLIGEAKIVTEAPYKTGTITATKNSTAITLASGTWDTTWTNRKIKIQGREEPFSIASFGSTTTATIADNWLGATASSLTYFMYRDVYTLPADCELTKELLLYDTVYRDQVDIVDYALFRARKRETGVILGIPCEIARLGVTAAGLAQIEFGPLVPDSEKVYQLDYFRSPQKPALITNGMNPAWPTAYEDVRVKRALWQYANRKGHPRRFEFEEQYRARIWDMKRKFDGGNEMRRRIHGTRRRASNSWNIHARLA